MTTATATLPRSAGNGAALVVIAANFVLDLLEKGMSAPKAKAAVPQALAAARTGGAPDIWQLYRLSAGSDSVSPKLSATLRRIAAD